MAAPLDALPIVAGLEYGLRVKVTGATPAFPANCKVRAGIRHYVAARDLIAELTIENGGLTRVDNDTIDVRIPAEATSRIQHDEAAIDFVRTDIEPDAYLYVLLQIPVIRSVTRVDP